MNYNNYNNYYFETLIRPDIICPISLSIMVDPVIAADGHTYERLYIEKWFIKSNNSPKTNKILHNKKLISNYNLKSIISCIIKNSSDDNLIKEYNYIKNIYTNEKKNLENKNKNNIIDNPEKKRLDMLFDLGILL